MGGNAFDKAERLTPHFYKDVVDDIKWLLQNIMGYGTGFTIPHSVRNKESYGDVDVLVASSQIQAALKQMKNGFRVVGEISNGCGYNLLIETDGRFIQVDLNKTKDEDMEFAFQYFSWNDLGNLIGRIAHRQGLKHGHDGLWYVHRDGDHQLGEILLTKDYDTALCHLGFDVNDYRAGFDSYEQMFEWVERCKYFEPSAFPLEHRNHQARVRDAKRKVYNMFLERLAFDGEYVPSDKAKHLERHKDKWPHLRSEILFLNCQNAVRKEVKAKLNGNIVRELTGLDGKELGELMQIVKRMLPEDKVYSMFPSEIEEGIMEAFERYKAEKNATNS